MNEDDIEKWGNLAFGSSKIEIKRDRIESEIFKREIFGNLFHVSSLRLSVGSLGSFLFYNLSLEGVNRMVSKKGGKERDTRHGTVTVSFPL